MRLLFTKKHFILFMLLVLAGFVYPKQAQAHLVPPLKGKVINVITNAPVPNVWVKMQTNGEPLNDYACMRAPAQRYELTDSAGNFTYNDFSVLGNSIADCQAYNPSLGRMIDTNFDGTNDAQQIPLNPDPTCIFTPYGTPFCSFSFGCSATPMTFSAVLPVGWTGNFSTISNVVFNNAETPETIDVGTINYRPVAPTPTNGPTSTPTPRPSSTPTPRPSSIPTPTISSPTPIGSAFTISGTVYDDNNSNGVKDASEPGHSAATVRLSNGNPTTTNSSGIYTFTVPAGSYTVTLTNPSGYSGTTPNPVTRTVGPNTTVNFGIRINTVPNCTALTANPTSVGLGQTSLLTVTGCPNGVPITFTYFDDSKIVGDSVTNNNTNTSTWTAPSSGISTTTPANPWVSACNGTSCVNLGTTITINPSPGSGGSGNVFVSSTKYSGNLGDLSGADAKCQTRANANSLGGVWKAWLSNDTMSASNRLFHSSSAYVRMDGVTVANNWADLTDGTLDAPINRTEFNTLSSSPGRDVITNTNTTGGIKSIGNSCNNWTSSSGGTFWVGSSQATNQWWTENVTVSCDPAGQGTHALYCFKQETPTPTPVPETHTISGTVLDNSSGTNTPYTGGGAKVCVVDLAGSNCVEADSSGSYSIIGVSEGIDDHQVKIVIPLPSGYTIFPPQAYIVSVGDSCQFIPNLSTASCNAGDIVGLDLVIGSSDPWIQSIGSDMRIDAGYDESPIPVDPVCDAYASRDGLGTTPGLIYTGTQNADFGTNGGQASSQNWVVGGSQYPETYAPLIIKSSYNYIDSIVKQNGINAPDMPSNLTAATHGVYRSNSDYTISGAPLNFSGGDYVFLIKGNLRISTEIHVEVGSTALFTVSGDIIIDKNVGETTLSCDVTSANSSIEGYYSADHSFIIKGNNSCLTPDSKLNVAGSIVANAVRTTGTFDNQRDLCAGNTQYPSFSIAERPDFVLNSPSLIQNTRRVFREIAP